ncbi:MAG: type II toxin-antitoxin system PemK/MazF family toxin [Elusimicrobia bacterium]|nr:type II toxin-antitoxin system PemK/MazF family toxin [Elusimicrobiota bacterium]
MIRRGEVYWVDFRNTIGAEIRKVRPAVVVSDDLHNDNMRTVTVAPLSSLNGPVQPHEAAVPEGLIGDGRASRVKTHQLRAVDKKRLGSKLGELPLGAMADVDASLRIHLSL